MVFCHNAYYLVCSLLELSKYDFSFIYAFSCFVGFIFSCCLSHFSLLYIIQQKPYELVISLIFTNSTTLKSSLRYLILLGRNIAPKSLR
ncbi:hypothetical protein MSHRCOH1_04325 [Candidatus Ornithobacterium hominis]|nr:hypothetical protein MSHRCOH1_04325 [Candidatus Ornithobacterium hominis]